MDAINSIVAANVRALREEQRLSLDALASMTGVSKSMLGMIERGAANPTIATLWKIANGLKVPFSRFMAHPTDVVEIRSVGAIQPLLSEEGEGYRYRNYPLFPLDETRAFEVYYIEIDPDGRLTSEPHPPGTQEILTIFSGSLEVRAGERVETVATGDSIRFYADMDHAYRNTGEEMCRLSMVIAYDSGR